MFRKDLLWIEAENNKISAKFLVSVEKTGVDYIGYRYANESNPIGAISPTLWEGSFVYACCTYTSSVSFTVAGDTTKITKSISITRLDTNKTLSGTGSYFTFAGRTIYNLNGALFTSSDVNRRIEIEVWYEI